MTEIDRNGDRPINHWRLALEIGGLLASGTMAVLSTQAVVGEIKDAMTTENSIEMLNQEPALVDLYNDIRANDGSAPLTKEQMTGRLDELVRDKYTEAGLDGLGVLGGSLLAGLCVGSLTRHFGRGGPRYDIPDGNL